jgi:tetratricopeptide (TPR) repeat protein
MPRSKSKRKTKTAKKSKKAPAPSLNREIRDLRRSLAGILQADADDDPAFRAQQLVWEAQDSDDPEHAIGLVMQAIELDPLCVDAYLMVASCLPLDSDEYLRIVEVAVDAGEEALGEQFFREEAGHFWGLIETRPYMRACADLAYALWDRGRSDEALGHLREMLRLNPNDNQGLRDVLAAWLIETGGDDELARLLKTYEEDDIASWAYSKSLAAFRREGESAESRRLLGDALASNAHVPEFLLDPATMPVELPDFYSPGDDTEAIHYVHLFGKGWAQTPGALDWLRRASGRAAAAE